MQLLNLDFYGFNIELNSILTEPAMISPSFVLEYTSYA